MVEGTLRYQNQECELHAWRSGTLFMSTNTRLLVPNSRMPVLLFVALNIPVPAIQLSRHPTEPQSHRAFLTGSVKMEYTQNIPLQTFSYSVDISSESTLVPPGSSPQTCPCSPPPALTRSHYPNNPFTNRPYRSARHPLGDRCDVNGRGPFGEVPRPVESRSSLPMYRRCVLTDPFTLYS